MEPEGAPQRAPGWYADPFRHARERWWDGARWTWQVTDDRKVVAWDQPPSDAAPAAPKGVRGVAVALIAFVASIDLSIAVQEVLTTQGTGGRVFRICVGSAVLWGGLIATCFLLSGGRGSGKLAEDFGFRVRFADTGFGFAGSLAGRLMTITAITPLAIFFRNVRAPEQDQLDPFTSSGFGGWIMLVLVVCIGAPIVEELFFRGVIQTRLVARWGPWRGIVVTSLLFGAAHMINWMGPITIVYAWGIAAAGVALGTMRHITGRVGTSIVAHFFFNLQVVVALAFAARIR